MCRSIEATNTQLASVSDMKEVHKIKTKFSGKTVYKNEKADFTFAIFALRSVKCKSHCVLHGDKPAQNVNKRITLLHQQMPF